MNGAPKSVASGKKGNVGGMMTPGRHGSHAAAMAAGVKNLVSSGPGTKKTAAVAKVRPEMNEGAMIKQDAMKKMPTMTVAKPAGVVMPHGSVKVRSNIRPEGKIKRDAMSVIKT